MNFIIIIVLYFPLSLSHNTQDILKIVKIKETEISFKNNFEKQNNTSYILFKKKLKKFLKNYYIISN